MVKDHEARLRSQEIATARLDTKVALAATFGSLLGGGIVAAALKIVFKA